jgi:predicted MFS family arabinose efflux permease
VTRINHGQPVRLRFQIVAFSVARTVINTGHRMVYPFLPTFARGVGVDLEAVALAVTARSALGLISPVFGSLADRRGRKTATITGMLIFAGGMALVTIWPTYPALFVTLALGGVGKLVYDPSMQAYIGDRVDYARRGLAIGITELSWSTAFLLGVPILGWLIDRSGYWQAPFPVLAGFSLVMAAMLWVVIPSDTPPASTAHPALTQGIRVVLRYSPALAGLGIALLISASNEVVSIIYGAWMEDAFGLQVAALGAASAVIGIAELTSEGTVAAYVDRLGKRRAVAVGIGANALACLLLPALSFGVMGALVALFLFFLTFEFAVVSLVPLMTELAPEARATLMAGNVAAFSGGRMVGALLGPPLFNVGLLANSATAAILNGIALVVLLIFLKHD